MHSLSRDEDGSTILAQEGSPRDEAKTGSPCCNDKSSFVARQSMENSSGRCCDCRPSEACDKTKGKTSCASGCLSCRKTATSYCAERKDSARNDKPLPGRGPNHKNNDCKDIFAEDETKQPMKKRNINCTDSCCETATHDSIKTSNHVDTLACCKNNTSYEQGSNSKGTTSKDKCKSNEASSINTDGVGDSFTLRSERLPESTKCCSTTNGPRCTEDCVLAYAEYDCTTSTHDHDSDVHAGVTPCSRHLQIALDTYGAMLKRAICLCQNIASSDVVRCCARKSPKTRVRQRGPASHCKSIQPKTRDDTTSEQKSDVCEDSCCTERKSIASITSVHRASRDPIPKDCDPEAAGKAEEVKISVQGMTCTGCETKLGRCLNSVKGVSDVRISFANGSADFRVDTRLTTAKEVVARAREITGFTITHIRRELRSVDLLITRTYAKELIDKPVSGIIDIEILNKNQVRIFYDPRMVGARTLIGELGSNISLAPVQENDALGKEKVHLLAMGIKTGLALIFTIPVCVLTWSPVIVSEVIKGIVSLILATIVQIIAVTEFYWKACKALFYSRSVELDMLIVISITAAYVYSVVAFGFLMAGEPLKIKEFFETSTLLTSLVLLGRLLAGYARVRAVASVSMHSLQETNTSVIFDDGSEQVLDARLLQCGDNFQVAAHARIPTDGIVLEGSTEVDESMLTGESTRVTKSIGSKIIAGTLNGQGQLKAKVDRLPGENTITDIANMVDAAQASKPRIQSLADIVASYFIPAILAITLIVFIIWITISLYVEKQPCRDAFVSTISYAVAVLAVSCPCAIGLAVPMVLVIASGIAARHGVIIKTASALEKAWSVTDVVFDKTGTLTTSELEVSEFEIYVRNHERAFAITHALTSDNNHPVSRGVTSFLNTKDLPNIEIGSTRSIPGKGIEATLGQSVVRAGNPEWLSLRNHIALQRWLQLDATLLCVTADQELLAVFALKSTIRPEAVAVVSQLRKKGLVVHLVSGDAEQPAVKTGEALGISNVRFRQSPAEKYRYVEQLASRSESRVLYCGDGTNDAAAVARANVGVCVGDASDVTSSSADVVLLGSLEGIRLLLMMSKAAFRRIIFNFIWSGIYNLFAILLAAGAFVAFRLPPAYAGLGELVSVVPVVIAATTMLFVGRGK